MHMIQTLPHRPHGFALATVLVASVVLLVVLVAAVSTTIAVGNGLREQKYLRHAGLAAEAGEVLKNVCLGLSNGTVTWSESNPLRPNTDCTGTVIPGKSEFVMNSVDEGVRTYFVVGSLLESKGYAEALRASSGLAWRVWSSTASAASSPGGNIPVGTYIEGAWTTAPAGYLLANGAAVSRATYANLFAVIGTTYGAGDGSTTFNLPDTRGRTSMALSTETEFNTLGKKGGEKTHTLTVAEMPSHRHTLSYGIVTPSASGTSVPTAAGGAYGFYYNTSPATANMALTGGGGAHNVLDPYVVVNRAIKY